MQSQRINLVRNAIKFIQEKKKDGIKGKTFLTTTKKHSGKIKCPNRSIAPYVLKFNNILFLYA